MNAPETGQGTSPASRVLALLAAAAGLGALVAATGAAIVWVRFEQAKLPGEQAVAAMPESALLAVGGTALGAFALVAGLAVLLAYLLESEGTYQRQASAALLLAGTGVALAALFTEAPARERLIAIGVTAVATLAAVALTAIALDTPRKEWVCKHQWLLLGAGVAAALVGAAVLAFVLHEVLAAIALAAVTVVLTGLLALAFASVDDKTHGILSWFIDRAGDLIRLLAAPAALAVLALVLYLILNEWWILAMVPVAAALVIGVLRVAFRTGQKFAWYGTSVFVAVVVFGATMHALRAVNVPRLQPMAILFTDEAGGGGQSGLFVSHASDRVYLGLVERCHRDPRDLVLRPGSPKSGTGHIVSVPRAQIAAESVGTMAELNTAIERAPRLLDALGKRFTPVGGEPPPLPVHPCSDEGVIDQKVRETSRVDPGTAARLAARWRPILRFDSQERWRPLNIDRLLVEVDRKSQPAHRLCDGVKSGNLHCSPIVLPSQIAAAPNDPKAFVNFAGVKLGGEEHRSLALDACPSQPRQEPALLDCDSGPASSIYYQVVAANQRYYVDYWWFLRYNRFAKHRASELCRSLLTRSSSCFDHEGDWEGVTVVLSDAGADRLDFVNYASHEGVFRYTREQIERVGRRPVVYVARGSHAGYPAKCANDCRQVARLLGRALPEDNTDGAAEWGRNGKAACDAEPSCLLPLPTSSWRVFAGLWGSRTCDDGDGACTFGVPPRSPAGQRRFKTPWCHNGVGLRLVCDGRLPDSR
ncbi:MAG TPA: hypothetical protein VFP78_11710 [Solirubrobacteraceae bacterium]|nr:hypothetical protein [Solirubrobacteraceae bacterium]